jgi:hypothetical protein
MKNTMCSMCLCVKKKSHCIIFIFSLISSADTGLKSNSTCIFAVVIVCMARKGCPFSIFIANTMAFSLETPFLLRKVKENIKRIAKITFLNLFYIKSICLI